jgi:DNA polymerase IV
MFSGQQRKIIHVDMDAFFAAVEVRDDPSLRGKPVAVGGDPGRRGVVSTCSYEARRFGIRSGMPSAVAVRRCPELVFLRPNFERYKTASRHLHAIFEDITDRIEPLSIDEAFLDVTGAPSATRIAMALRERIRQELRLTASAGVAPNKFLAKVASDFNKPDGLVVVTPTQVDDFVRPLGVERIHGVGPVTAGRMEALGLRTCADLQGLTKDELQHRFGSFGGALYRLCRGIDERPVVTSWERKSLSVEETYAEDLPGMDECLGEIAPLHGQLVKRLARLGERGERRGEREEPVRGIKTLLVKLKFQDFQVTTVQVSGDRPDLEIFQDLCRKAWGRGRRPVRLVGLGVRFAEACAGRGGQLTLPFAVAG